MTVPGLPPSPLDPGGIRRPAPGPDPRRLSASGRRRFDEARTRGYLLTEQSDPDRDVEALWRDWCAAHRRPSVTVFRYRGVDQPARIAQRWRFLTLAGVELSLLPAGSRLTAAGIEAVGRAFVAAGIGPDQPWTVSPQRVSAGRVPPGADERLARALVELVATTGALDTLDPDGQRDR